MDACITFTSVHTCGIIAAQRLLYAHVGRDGPRAVISASGRDGRVAYYTMNEIHGIMTLSITK